MKKPIKHLKKKLEISIVVSYSFFALLVVLLTIANLSNSSGPSFKIWLIQVTPLLLILPGMIMRYYRSYSWLCFVLLGYFIIAVEHSFMSTASIFDHIYLTITVVLFISAMFTSRWMQFHQKTIE